MHDVIARKVVEVTISSDATRLWVNVDGRCELRVNAPIAVKQMPLTVVIDDRRFDFGGPARPETLDRVNAGQDTDSDGAAD